MHGGAATGCRALLPQSLEFNVQSQCSSLYCLPALISPKMPSPRLQQSLLCLLLLLAFLPAASFTHTLALLQEVEITIRKVHSLDDHLSQLTRLMSQVYDEKTLSNEDWTIYTTLGAFLPSTGELIGVLMILFEETTGIAELPGRAFYIHSTAVDPGFPIESVLVSAMGMPWMLSQCHDHNAKWLYLRVPHANFTEIGRYTRGGFKIWGIFREGTNRNGVWTPFSEEYAADFQRKLDSAFRSTRGYASLPIFRDSG